MYKNEKKEADQVVFGVVADFVYKLNIRAEPDLEADVIFEAEPGTEFLIDIEKSTEEWFSVCSTSGLEGFCKKKYITIKE